MKTAFLIILLCFFSIKNLANPQDFSKANSNNVELSNWKELNLQLEKDICLFPNIQNAKVHLDWDANEQKCIKAALLVSLKNEAKLSKSQILSMIFHLSGSVHLLEPNCISLADTDGTLYQAWDLENSFNLLEYYQRSFEEEFKMRTDRILEKIFGSSDYFYSQVVLTTNTAHDFSTFESWIGKVTVNLLFDKALYNEDAELLQGIVERTVSAEFSHYTIPLNIQIDWIPFFPKQSVAIQEFPKKDAVSMNFYSVLMSLFWGFVSAAAAILLFRYKPSNKQKKITSQNSLILKSDEDPLFKTMTRIDLNQLVESFKHEDPETIALMLSYLESEKAKKIIETFDSETKSEVLRHYNHGKS